MSEPWNVRDDPHVRALARTLWGEARGEGRAGMEAVAAVIMNRLADRRWPNTVSDVVMQPWQFSVWNTGDPNRAPMLAVGDGDPSFRMALEVAIMAIEGQLKDPTNGANHYHTHRVQPAWSRGVEPTVIIGNHRFFRL